MILRDEAPIARVGGVVAVVAHHPIVVHLESVIVSGLAIDVDLVALYLQVVQLVSVDDALVQRQSVDIQRNRNALLGDVERPEVVDIPRIEVGAVGEEACAGVCARCLYVAHHGGDVRQLD